MTDSLDQDLSPAALLGQWDIPSIWCSKYYFFHKIFQNNSQKPFQFIILFSYKIAKIKIKSFECPKSIRNYEKKNTWNIRLECATWLPETWEPEKKTCESRHRTGQVWDFQTSGFPNSTRRGLEATWFILWIFYCTWRPENTTLASKMIPFCIPFCIAFCIPFCIPFIRRLVDESHGPSKPLIWVCKF